MPSNLNAAMTFLCVKTPKKRAFIIKGGWVKRQQARKEFPLLPNELMKLIRAAIIYRFYRKEQ